MQRDAGARFEARVLQGAHWRVPARPLMCQQLLTHPPTHLLQRLPCNVEQPNAAGAIVDDVATANMRWQRREQEAGLVGMPVDY